MSWTAPMTAIAGQVLTAAQWNTYVRDNLLQCPAAQATQASQLFVSGGANSTLARTIVSSYVGTTESTTSSSYGDLTTVGPGVNATTGPQAIVFMSASIVNSIPMTYTTLMAFEVSGATSQIAWDAIAVGSQYNAFAGSTFIAQNLTPGVNTFTAKYRVSGGIGYYAARWLTVIPL
jgi:hypothetical protein